MSTIVEKAAAVGAALAAPPPAASALKGNLSVAERRRIKEQKEKRKNLSFLKRKTGANAPKKEQTKP